LCLSNAGTLAAAFPGTDHLSERYQTLRSGVSERILLLLDAIEAAAPDS
jgi:hypothetical protein